MNKQPKNSIKSLEDFIKPIFTKKSYEPEALEGIPAHKISYVVKFIFNGEEIELGSFLNKEEAIICLAEKHDDIYTEYGCNENEDNIIYDSDEYFEVEIGKNHFLIKIVPVIMDY